MIPSSQHSRSPADPRTAVRLGVALCRRGRWSEGLAELGRVAALGVEGDLPSLFYSYLGYGVAWREGRLREGLDLCERAVEAEFFRPENHVNLGRVFLLRHQRRRAVRCLETATELDPENREVVRFREQLGVRATPALPWLARSNPLNLVLGKLRHRLARPG